MGIDDRIVGRLQPHHAAMGINALEAFGDELAAAQLVPERVITHRVVLFRFAEQAVMFAHHLVELVAHGLQEALVGRQHFTVEVELDHRRGAHQRLDQALVLAGGFDGAGQVAGVQGEVFDAPFAVFHRLQDRAQPGLFAIAPQQAESAIEMLATGNGVLHALVKVELLDVRRDDFLDVAANQLMAAVAHLFFEVAVDRFDAPLRVELQHQHLAVEAALYLLH
ncbi:hypothetical protein D3C85_1191160 [compost metagenome]